MSDTMNIKRRTVLLSLGAGGLLAACGGGGGSDASGSKTQPPPTTPPPQTSARVPLTIDATQTDLPAGTLVYAYIVGLVSSTNGDKQYHVDANGMPHLMDVSDNTIAANTFPGSASVTAADAATLAGNYPRAWADYSIPVSLTTPTVIDLANLNTSTMPGLGTGVAALSGRIYISVGVPKLPFSVVDSSSYTAPVPVGFPGSYTLFDWIEFSYDSNGAFNGNPTQVDQFGFPLLLNCTPGGTLQGAMSQSRSAIFNAIAGLDSAYVLTTPVNAPSAYPGGINMLRALSPKSITAQGGYNGGLAHYFDTTIANWYTTWQTTPLVTSDLSTGPYSGVVATGGTLTFYQGSYTTLGDLQAANPPVAFEIGGSSGIPSLDVWQCANSLATGGDAEKNVGKMIAAAFQRDAISNSLNDATCQNDVATFYPGGGTFNEWAKLFHQVSANGLAYGFPYDDVCGQNPSIGIAQAQSVTITLGKFFS